MKYIVTGRSPAKCRQDTFWRTMQPQDSPSSQKRIRVRVIHIVEAFGGGLRTAVVNYLTATPQIDHTLFARCRTAHDTTAVPDSARFESYTGGLVGFYSEAMRLVADNDYDIVHLHASYAGLLRAILPSSMPVVYSPHCYAMEERRTTVRMAAWAAERVLAVRPQLLSAVSPREIELGHRLRKSMPAHLVPNAVAPTQDVSEGPPGGGDRPTIAMLGRICRQKAPRYFADVAKLGGERYRYLWVGEGDTDRDALVASGVEITGWVSPDRMRELLASIDLYVHTAAWEGGPLATLEAAAAGTPLICRDIPSMRSLGYELAGTTPSETMAAVDRYFSDDEYQARVRDSTRGLLETYSIQRMSESLIAAYESALRTGSGAGRRRG